MTDSSQHRGRFRLPAALLGILTVAAVIALAIIQPWAPSPTKSPEAPAAADSTDGLGSAADPPPVMPDEPAATTRMGERERLFGDITPKSITSNRHGTLLASNMMYSHSITVFDAETRTSRDLSDSVDLTELGVDGFPGITKGAPVESAWTADGRYAYVSQYTLYGEGAGRAGNDKCLDREQIRNSVLLRYDTEKHAWDQAIEVGRVPKYVEISPDGRTALVSNWCDSTISVVDLERGEETAQIPVDAAPRGIVILPDNRTAYATAMYADELYRLDIESGTSEFVMKTGRKPRHLTLSPDGSRMYLTLSGADRLLALDPATGEVVDETRTGREPRSMTISADGTALYVVNYYENTVSKFDAATLEELQREPVGTRPIGVAYEQTTGTVWVANYAGSVDVFDDTLSAEEAEETEEADEDHASDAPASDGGR